MQAQSTVLSTLQIPAQLENAIETVTKLFTSCIQEAAEDSIPKAKKCKRSKLQQNKDLAEQQKEASKALRHQQQFANATHARRAKTRRDNYLYAVKQAKAEHQNKFLQSAKGKDIFKAL